MRRGKKETAQSRSIQDMLRARGIPHCRIQCGKVRVRGGWMELAEGGYPDIWTPLAWLETKTGKGELRNIQIEMHEELRAWGERIEVVRSAREANERIDELTKDFSWRSNFRWP